ncbi:MAG: hypothetical protein AAF479_03555 [Pseudomonadota bacterium]
MAEQDPYDSAGLIREAFRIEGIGREDCRSIFLDWVIGHRERFDMTKAVEAMLARHSGEPADHPMTLTLREALETAGPPKRRGGARARRG